MNKTEVILKEVGENLFPYIKAGKLKPESIIKDIDVNLNINNIDKLIRIHYILKQEVIDFVRNLEDRVRNVKTSTVSNTSISRRGIRGKINWTCTFAQRAKTNPKDYSVYAYSKRDKEFEIHENLVLKELLRIIITILNNDLKYANQSYDWLNTWFKKDNLRDILNNVYHKNIYLRKINLNHSKKVTHRMITKTQQSRKLLYREAAELLLKYRKLMNHELNEEEAKELLRSTFIQPEKEDVLFELYWVIKIIKQFDKQESNTVFNLIDSKSDSLISYWTDENFKYNMYHDSVGSFNFREPISGIKELPNQDNFIKRQAKVFQKLIQLNFNKEDILWGGRPDIILEKRDINSDKIICLFIGEVKNTKNKKYAIQGFKELLEYMVHIKHESKYFNKEINNLFENNKVKGALFVDSIPDLQIIDSNIKIYKFGDSNLNIKI